MKMTDEMKSILNELSRKQITLFMDHGKLKYRALRGRLEQDDLKLLKDKKKELIEYLKEHDREIQVIEAPEDQYKPFPLTDVQAAYALGRNHTFDYGGVACHVYMELSYEHLNAEKVQQAWNQLIDRHEMLRAVVYENGTQRVLERVSEFQIQDYDVQRNENQEAKLNEIRSKMGNALYDLGSWPMFEIAISHLETEDILHVSMEFLIADWKSIWMLLGEFETIYDLNQETLPEISLTFRDYLIAEKKLKETERYIKDKEYWNQRIDELPEAPKLPQKRRMTERKPRFTRKFLELDQEKWLNFKKNAGQYGITPTAAVLTVYAKVLERWSQTSKFCINLTVLNRMPLHKQVDEIVGDFTSISLLEVDMEETDSFLNHAKKITGQLFEDLDHRLFSGVEVIRELARRRGREQALMPIVFTSAIGLSDQTLKGQFHGSGISQTPQVFIDCQVMDGAYGLQADWDVREGIFPDGVIQDMFDTFKEGLIELAENKSAWESNFDFMLPKWQSLLMKKANHTKKELKPQMLYSQFMKYVRSQPEKLAVVDLEGQFTYSGLHQKALGIAKELHSIGVKPGEQIAILMKKGRYQAASALGILYAGCTYIPIDINQPYQRRKKIIEDADIRIILSLSEHKLEYEKEVNFLNADEIESTDKEEFMAEASPSDIAYIIFTSGTTGIPKGVVITHKAAVNTIEDINQKFDLSAQDTVLGLSRLNFDLSVYDIFGILSCGGMLVYPSHSRYMDPSYWAELILEYNITVWNTVPAFMQMLTAYLSKRKITLPLKVVMLSGDWIPVSMPSQIRNSAPDARVISLGGATEASIWSIYHECERNEEEKSSIPYGKPLSNQGFSILDRKGRECPVFVTGELYIWGDGLAKEYYNDKSLTEEKFLYDPEHKRMYKTGDIGCYLPNGEIEFRGRNDNQVKIRGHRIELGEIQHALEQNIDVLQAMAVLNNEKTEIIAFIKKSEICETGSVRELKRYVSEYLPDYMVPAEILFVESFPLTPNGKVDRKQISALIAKRTRENKDKEKLYEVSDELQSQLIEMWKEIVPESEIGIQDNFYDLGADSLILAQMATKIRERITGSIAFDAILREMIYNPTIFALSNYIRYETGPAKEKKEEITKKDSSIAFVREYGGLADKGLIVIFHGALGSLNRFDFLANRLLEKEAGKVIGIGIKDVDQYCSMNTSNLIATLSKEYAKLILSYGIKEIQLVGYCFGGVLAVETANRLNEEGSASIRSLSILDSILLPPTFKVEDELLMEMMFLDNIPVSFEDIGMPNPKLYEQLIVQESMKKTVIKKGFLESITGSDGIEKLGSYFRKLAAMAKEDRFAWYANLCEKNTGTKMPLDLIKSLYQVCVTTFAAMHYEICPYFGTIHYFFAVEGESGFKKMVLEIFESLALGEFKVIEIPGDHYSCVETKKNAEYLAEVLGSEETAI